MQAADAIVGNRWAVIVEWRNRLVKAWKCLRGDRTEHPSAPLDQRHREEWFRQIGENLPGALWVADLKWKFLYLSPGYEAVFQRPVHDFLENQQSFLDCVHPDDREELVAAYRERPTGTAFEEEFRVLLPDGSVHWVRNRAFPVRLADGQIGGMTGLATNITEGKHAEEALRRSEAGFRQLADAMPQIVWATDANGVVDYYNRQWYDFTGLEPDTLGNDRWGEFVHPEDLASMTATWIVAMESGNPFEAECRLRRRTNDEYRWFLARALPVRGTGGQIERWYGTSTDITDRKETEAALAATAERLRLAMETSYSGTWDWNIVTGAVHWSPEHNKMFGLPRQQRAGSYEGWLACVHPEDRALAESELKTALAEHRDFNHEIRALHPDGSVRWIVDSGRAFYNAVGQPTRMLGVVRDITASKEAELALRESEQRFRLASLHSPFPVILFADDGEVLLVNEAWTRLTGYDREELRTVKDWIERAYFDKAAEAEVQRFLTQFSVRMGDSIERPGRRFRCKDGSERLWDLSVVNLGQLPDGRNLRIASGIDVTERHRNEGMLRKAKEEAERANAAKSLFMSRMSHELRTPLNAILGFGQVLGMSSLGEQDTQCVNYLLKGGQHLLTLVDELLDLTRAETGELGLKPTAVSVEKLVRECIGLTSKMAQARQIVASVEKKPPGAGIVQADEQRLRQVLLNLLSNAIKYNRPGGRVVIGWKYLQGNRLRLSVRDTGPGISAEDLGRLFVPFERLGHEYGEVEGSGLGLVVSKQLAEAMAGRLGAESEVEVGSTFWVELPAAEDDVERTAAVANKRPATVRKKAAPAATLLYVEDNFSNLQVVKTIAARLRPHWHFLCATDGQAGLDLAREALPDLILLDLQLPKLKGDAVLTELRQSPLTCQTPVLMLSADATAHSRERLLSLGANDYLSKPFDMNILLEKIDKMLPTPDSPKKRGRAARSNGRASKKPSKDESPTDRLV